LLLQMLLYAALAPAVVGLVRWFTARLQARRGASMLQPYRDLAKLLRKPSNLPRITTWFFSFAPGAIFACYLVMGIFLPTVYLPATAQAPALQPPLANWFGLDLIFLIYLLGLARFMETLGSFDAAAQFGSMSGSRQLYLHVLGEPALLAVTYALVQMSHTSNIAGILLRDPGLEWVTALANPALILILLALGAIVLAESGRLPFDNPGGHLELTMIEQGTHLEYSGRVLALVEWANAMKLTFFLALLAGLALPGTLTATPALGALGVALLWFVAKLVVLVFLLSLWEVSQTKLRLRSVAYPLVGALVLALVAVVLLVSAARS